MNKLEQITGTMQPQIEQGAVYEVDTSDGTFFIPEDVIGYQTPSLLNTENTKGAFLDFTTVSCSDDIYDITYHADKYLARLSMSGYMDCTDWTMHDTEQEAINCLVDMYGDD